MPTLMIKVDGEQAMRVVKTWSNRVGVKVEILEDAERQNSS